MHGCRCLAEKPGEQRHQQKANQGNAAASHELFHALAFSPRIVITIAFQQVNDAPDSETCAKGDDEGLKNIDSRVKEIHKCVYRNIRDIGLEVGSHNASAGAKTAVRLPIPASPFNFWLFLFAPALQYEPVSSVCHGVSSLLALINLYEKAGDSPAASSSSDMSTSKTL